MPQLTEATPAKPVDQRAARAPRAGEGFFPCFPPLSPLLEVTGIPVPTSQTLSKEAARPQEAEKDQVVGAECPGKAGAARWEPAVTPQGRSLGCGFGKWVRFGARLFECSF